MSLVKRTYVDQETVITAENLNDIQDAIIENENALAALGTAATKNVPSSGDAGTTEVVLGNDTRLTDSRNAKDVYPWAKAQNKPNYTASEVGAIPATQKGAANGVANLDNAGKVPTTQLPSYVDDVIEGYYYNGAFYSDSAHTTAITPETGKIYVDLSTDTTYRWSGNLYVEISNPIDIDSTLTEAGKAADAKAVGDALAAIHQRAVQVVDQDAGITYALTQKVVNGFLVETFTAIS